MEQKFFSIAEMKQPVNQWLCIAFFGIWCFWIVLYFMTQHAEAVGNTYTTGFDLVNNL